MSKTENILVWVTPDIKKRIEERATSKGMKVGEYLRSLVDKDLESQ